MPWLSIYVDEKTMKRLDRIAEESCRSITDLAAIANAAFLFCKRCGLIQGFEKCINGKN